MADAQFNNPYGKEFNRTQDAPGGQATGLVGFLIKISGGHLKVATATNILVVVTVVSFTLSAIIFSNMFFSQKNNKKYKPVPILKETILPGIKQGFPEITDKILEKLPETFYREDVPSDIMNKLPQEVINSIPPRP